MNHATFKILHWNHPVRTMVTIVLQVLEMDHVMPQMHAMITRGLLATAVATMMMDAITIQIVYCSAHLYVTSRSIWPCWNFFLVRFLLSYKLIHASYLVSIVPSIVVGVGAQYHHSCYIYILIKLK